MAKAFGDILKLVKDTAILWADTIDESKGLTSEQIGLLDDLVRDLLTQVADKVEQYANGDVTLSHEGLSMMRMKNCDEDPLAAFSNHPLQSFAHPKN